MIFTEKKEARHWARSLLKGYRGMERARLSEAAAVAVEGLPEFIGAELVLAFLPMEDEIDARFAIEAALSRGQVVAAPRIEGTDIAFVPIGREYRDYPPDGYGIPVPPASLRALPLAEMAGVRCLALVPGLLFDARGGRLGRGKGFYDRFLASMEGQRPGARGGSFAACGFCYAAQIVEAFPREPHDRSLDRLVCDAGLVNYR